MSFFFKNLKTKNRAFSSPLYKKAWARLLQVSPGNDGSASNPDFFFLFKIFSFTYLLNVILL